MKYILAVLTAFAVSLAGCNSTDNYGDIFNVYSIVAGKVSSQQTGKPIQDAKIFFDVTGMGPECQRQYLAKPNRYDSTTTDSEGAFSARLTFINMDGPICVQAYAKSFSDTVYFSTELKREAPFDTTRITLSVKQALKNGMQWPLK